MYRSILIADKDIDFRNMAIPVPWNSTASAFNMKTPTEVMNVKNYESKESFWNALGDVEEIQALFVACDLEEEAYAFLEQLHNLRQLYLYTAEKLTHMNFIKKMIHLKDLYINHSHICDITPIVELANMQKKEREQARGKKGIDIWNLQLQNIAITDAKISDMSPFETLSSYFSELDLSGNQIEVLPAMEQLSIYYLTMEGNRLKSIQEYMDAHNSYLMDFRNNQIQDVTFMLQKEYGVSRFFITGNPCEYRFLSLYNFVRTDVD